MPILAAFDPAIRHFPVAPSSERIPWRKTALKPGSDRAKRLCELAVHVTAAAFAVPISELVAPSRRSAYIAFARQSAMYLAHVRCGLSFSEVGSVFGRDRTTAAHACRLVEDRRDDPTIDAFLASLEDAFCMLCCCLIVSVRP